MASICPNCDSSDTRVLDQDKSDTRKYSEAVLHGGAGRSLPESVQVECQKCGHVFKDLARS